MRIETLPCLSDNLSYLVIDDETRTCVAIDTGEARPFFEAIKSQSLRLIAILATHHHYDHVGALSRFPEVPVWSSERDLDRVPGAGKSQDRHTFKEGDALTWSQLAGSSQVEQLPGLNDVHIQLSTIAIPGHTEGQVALIFTESRASGSVQHVFVGDTLFALGCGRCLEGTPEILFESLQKLKALPPDSKIYFGHEYTEKNALFWISHASRDPSLIDSEKLKRFLIEHSQTAQPKPAPTLSHELDLNPFLRIKNASDFKRWRELRNDF